MPYGYHGKILHVHLSEMRLEVETPPEEFFKTYVDGEWACAEISNTGEISQEVRSELLEGEAEGRGLYITQRIVRLLKGKLEIRGGKGMTTIVVKLPLYHSSKEDGPNQLSLLENDG